MAWVYVLLLSNKKHYIGSTTDLEKRILDHNRGFSRFTSKHLPADLVFSQRYPNYSTALKVELWLKKQKSSSLLEKIISEGKIEKKF